MKYNGKLEIDQAQLDALNDLCDELGSIRYPYNETIYDEEVVFDNGMRVAIQVIASESDICENVQPPAWTQGVLFTPDGYEVSFTEVGDKVDGLYHCPDGDDLYIVEVVGGG